jgi:iron-sulfur cluster repair protein YtfE (RIC family)
MAINTVELVSVLSDAHKRYLKGEIQRIRRETRELAAEGDAFANEVLSDVERNMLLFDEHINEEENVLFPKIVRAEKLNAALSSEREVLLHYRAEIDNLIEHHEEIKPFLDKAIAWGGYRDRGNLKVAALSRRFATFEIMLRAHILIEEELLFPYARELFKDDGGSVA